MDAPSSGWWHVALQCPVPPGVANPQRHTEMLGARRLSLATPRDSMPKGSLPGYATGCRMLARTANAGKALDPVLVLWLSLVRAVLGRNNLLRQYDLALPR